MQKWSYHEGMSKPELLPNGSVSGDFPRHNVMIAALTEWNSSHHYALERTKCRLFKMNVDMVWE